MRVSLLCLLALSASALLLLSVDAAPFASSKLHARTVRYPHRKPHHDRPINQTGAVLPSSPMDACSFNGIAGSCVDVSTCTGTATSIQNQCAGPDNIQCCIEQDEAQPGCGTAAVARGQTWVNMQLLYCQSANGQPDGDSDCSSVCNRAHNPAWDAYRSDCSGFVSYCYGLPAPGRTTGLFAPYQTDISHVLPGGAKDLQTGDAINSNPREHIMLFDTWLNDDYTAARFFEEPGCAANPPYARVTDTEVKIQTDGTITLQSNGMNFFAIRMNSNSPTC